MQEQKQLSQQPFPWFEDTDPKALEAFIECQRRMTPGEKLAQVFELNRTLRLAVEANVRKHHPEATEREVFLRSLVRLIGPELVRKAYGWDAESSASVAAGVGSV